jgi:sugar lactone lactonase YvrE
MRREVAILLVAACACGSTTSEEELRARTPEAPTRAKSARGTRAIDIEWTPNGLAWDSGERALYAVDQSGNRIMRWTDRRGFQVAASLPRVRGGGASGLGGVARLPDGRTAVARAAGGKGGNTIILVSEARGAELLAELASDRKRVGVAAGPEGILYVTATSPDKDGPPGRITRVDLGEPSETDLPMGDILKPVGVVVVDGVLYVSDQARGEVVAMSLVPLGSAHAVAQLKSPDMMAAGPNRSVLIASKTGAVWQLFADGRLIRLLTAREEVRGITYDPAGKRMFFAEYDAHPEDGVEHRLQIVPLQ